VAVPSALPLALAVLEIDAREDAAVEAEGVAFVNDEVIEVGFQAVRRPPLFDAPSAGSVCHRDAADSGFGESGAAANQDVTASDHGWLHNAVDVPLMLPEQRAVSRGDADHAFAVEQQDLRDAVDRRELWRAVSHLAGRAVPARLASAEVVGREHTGG